MKALSEQKKQELRMMADAVEGAVFAVETQARERQARRLEAKAGTK